MGDLEFEGVPIEEQQSVEGLGLGGECHDAVGSDRKGGLAVVEREIDVAADPEPIGLLFPASEVSSPTDHGYLVHRGAKRGSIHPDC